MNHSPTPQQSHLVPGFRLDRYELLYPLAQGGMATVWVSRLLGKHGFEKLIAIKTILPQYADDPAFQKMFLDEARIASMIRHPNVAEIIDLGEAENTLYIAMEYVDGDSWSKLHNAAVKAGSRIPISILLRVAADAAAGLHAAHELRDSAGQLLQVVHRDVSPQNVLVGMNGHTKLIDFGVAKARDRMSQETSAGLVKGKIQYASPEQALGSDVDRRTDVWALGTILYQMLAGRLPYDADNQVAMLHMLTSGHPPPALPGSVPPNVAAVIMRSLQPQREHRFASCAEFQAALESVMPERATTHDVSAFSRQFLADRAAARQQDLANALAAAAHRQAMGAAPPHGSGDPNVMRPHMATQQGGFGMLGHPSGNMGGGMGSNPGAMQQMQQMHPQHTPASGSTQAAMAVPVQANMTTMSGTAGPTAGRVAMRGSQWVAVIGAVVTSFIVWTGSGVFALRANAADAAAAGQPPGGGEATSPKAADPAKTDPAKTDSAKTEEPPPVDPPKTAEPVVKADPPPVDPPKTSKVDKADKTAGTAPAKTAAATPAPPTATAVVKVTPPAGTKPPGKKKKVDDGF